MSLLPESQRARRVLITGANGFVGSHIARGLSSAGFATVACLRKGADTAALDGLPISHVYADVTNPASFLEALDGVDAVVHNAGVVKARDEGAFFRVNADGVENVCAAGVARGVKRLILISSLAALGPSHGVALTEEDPPHPLTVYGRSKLEGERIAMRYADRLRVQILRLAGVYGPGDRETLAFFRAVASGVRPAIGDTRRKTQVVFVDDVADAVVRLLRTDAPTGEIYHIAHPRAHTFDELMASVSRAVGKRGIRAPIPAGIFALAGWISQTISGLFGGAPTLTVDKTRELLAEWLVNVEKASAHFDFVGQVDFESGAQQAAVWYRERGWL